MQGAHALCEAAASLADAAADPEAHWAAAAASQEAAAVYEATGAAFGPPMAGAWDGLLSCAVLEAPGQLVGDDLIHGSLVRLALSDPPGEAGCPGKDALVLAGGHARLDGPGQWRRRRIRGGEDRSRIDTGDGARAAARLVHLGTHVPHEGSMRRQASVYVIKAPIFPWLTAEPLPKVIRLPQY